MCDEAQGEAKGFKRVLDRADGRARPCGLGLADTPHVGSGDAMSPTIENHAERIAELVAELELAPPKFRLHMLRSAVIGNGGRWDLPSDKGESYDPVIKEIQVFGVPAFAMDAEELPRNWMRAAMNVLSALEGNGEAA